MILGASFAFSTASWLATRSPEFLQTVNPQAFLTFAVVLLVIYGGFTIYWTREVFRFDPALVVDANGILDRRLGPDPIPWDLVYDIKLRGSRGRPFLALAIDLPPGGLSRVSGLRRYFAPLASKDGDRHVHIALTGLAAPPAVILQAFAEVLDFRGRLLDSQAAE